MTSQLALPSADLGREPRSDDRADVVARRLIAAVGLLVAVGLGLDLGASQLFGWDTQVNCAAVEAYRGGLDPYYVRNLSGTTLSYTYLPVTLDVFRPLCAGGVLVAHYRVIYLLLAVVSALLLPSLSGSRRRDAALRIVFVFGGFLGFQWVIATGNFAMLSGLATSAALALLLREPASSRKADRAWPLFAGAMLLGLVTSFKLVFLPLLAALYLLPRPRARKLALIAVALAAFALPVVISATLYADLFASWLSAIFGQIPGQHSPANEINHSLTFLSLALADQFGLAANRPVVAAVYAFAAIALVLAPLAISLWRRVGAAISADRRAPLAGLDRWLSDHPIEALRLTVLVMYALFLCAPRVKEYAFFELALYAAVLIVDLPFSALATVLIVSVVIPALAALAGNAFTGVAQLLTALACFWILLSRLPERAAEAQLRLGAGAGSRN